MGPPETNKPREDTLVGKFCEGVRLSRTFAMAELLRIHGQVHRGLGGLRAFLLGHSNEDLRIAHGVPHQLRRCAPGLILNFTQRLDKVQVAKCSLRIATPFVWGVTSSCYSYPFATPRLRFSFPFALFSLFVSTRPKIFSEAASVKI